jgi:hypothetical protein
VSGLKLTMTLLASKARSDSYLILDRSLVATSTRFDFYYNVFNSFNHRMSAILMHAFLHFLSEVLNV